VKLVLQDLQYNKRELTALMEHLDGVQPRAEVFAMAVHAFDGASNWAIGGVSQMHRDNDACSPWASFEGQLVHDMISYVHRLNRSSPKSRPGFLKALKALCPTEPKTRPKKFDKSSGLETPEVKDEDESADGDKSGEAPAEEDDDNDLKEVPSQAAIQQIMEHIAEHNPGIDKKKLEEAAVNHGIGADTEDRRVAFAEVSGFNYELRGKALVIEDSEDDAEVISE
jgi:hypothetical protein